MNGWRLNLKSIFTLLTAGPLLIGYSLLIICFSVMHYERSKEIENTIDEIASLFFKHTNLEIVKDNARFSEIANQLLEFGHYQSIALLDANTKVIYRNGVPINPKILLTLSTTTARVIHSRHKRYHLIPLHVNTQKTTLSSNPEYRLLVVTDSSRYTVIHYQWSFVMLLLFITVATLAYMYHKKINSTIFLPLKNLNSQLDDIIENKKNQTIHTEHKGIYSSLTKKINQLFILHNELQDQLHNNMEITTKELRESLETLEIRNIELDIARKKALELTKLKSDFLANTSHEIRTPLNGIIGFSELLKKTHLNSDQRDHLSTIEDSAKGLLTIISDILDFSRMDTGKLSLDYKLFTFLDTVEDALILQAPHANEKNIKIHFIPDNHIPQKMLGDPLRLQQVISNLVANAIKFSDSGRVAVYCHKLDRDDNKIGLKFIVQDDGIGLDLNQSDRLFESFSQGQSSNDRRFSGTGLGLTIAKGLVQRMDGEIGVESEQGKGSSFWFTVVFGRNNEIQELSTYASTLTNVNVLLFDSDHIGQFEVSSKLNLWGATTHSIDRFEDISENAQNLSLKAKKYARFYPVAIIDAQTEASGVNTEKLRNLVNELSVNLNIPTIIISPPGKYGLIGPLLKDTNAILLQRPFKSLKLYKAIFDQLGIFSRRPINNTPNENYSNQNKKIRVLVVDDNLSNLRLAKELLKDFNTETDTATNGKEAIKYTQNTSYDLILMDIQMPDLNGYETTVAIRNQEPSNQRIPIIALTAHAVAEEKTKILLSGMDDFLSKPIGSTEISHIIDRWVIKNTQKNLKHQIKIEKESTFGKNTSSTSPVSISQSLSLAKNKPDLAKDMLQMLISSLPKDHELINTYYSNKNHDLLHEIVHKLHGGCCYCGVPSLLAAAKKVDKSLQEKKTSHLEEDITTLLNAIKELLAWNDEHDLEILFEAFNE